MRTRLIVVLVLTVFVLLPVCRRAHEVNLAPDVPATPSGPSAGLADSVLTFTTTTTDPEGSSVSVRFDWGDGDTSDWIESTLDGATFEATHAWTWNGAFEVRAQARDDDGILSDWSGAAGLEITGAFVFGWEIIDTIPCQPLSHFTALPSGERVYAMGDWDYTVLVIDTRGHEVVDTIRLRSGYGGGIAVHPGGEYLYATAGYPGDSRLWVIRTADGVLVGEVPVPYFARGVVVTPDGGYVYVACCQRDTVAVVRTADNSVVALVAVGSEPNAVAVHPDGREVYVLNDGSQSVSIIRTSDNTVVADVPVRTDFEQYASMAISPDGRYLFVPDGRRYLQVVDTRERAVTVELSVGLDPLCVSVDPTGRFVVVGLDNSEAWPVVSIPDLQLCGFIETGDEAYGVHCFPGGEYAYLSTWEHVVYVARIAASPRGAR